MIESKKHPQAADDTRADLAERAADQREEKQKNEEAKCLEILRTSGYLTDRERTQERVLGTCSWFLRHLIYQKWKIRMRTQSFVYSTRWTSAMNIAAGHF